MGILQKVAEHPGFMFMRGVSRFGVVRRAVAGAQRFARRGRYRELLAQIDPSTSVFKTLDVDGTVSDLKKDGVALGVDLPDDVLQQITKFSSEAIFYADRDPTCGFKPADVQKARVSVGHNFILAQCFNVADQCGVVRQLEMDPKLLLVAAKYLGTRPVHVGTNLWWSYAVPADMTVRNKAAQLFHYDLDDYAFVKFFFYLTDVDQKSGPHVCVRGSHRHKRFESLKDHFLVRRFSDAQIRDTYGVRVIKTICGKAGTGFAEDTLCIHKGEPPAESDRLLLQIQYAINDHGNQHDRVSPEKLRNVFVPV